jgi:hypothetical protein
MISTTIGAPMKQIIPVTVSPRSHFFRMLLSFMCSSPSFDPLSARRLFLPPAVAPVE